MATIKSYTDIEQSKKLAEILPIETADMWVHPYWDDVPNIGNADLSSNQIPCWSLAALIEQMPSDIKGHELTIRKSYWQIEKTSAYELSYEEDFEDYPPSILISTSSIELIDACVKMIIKLNELKML